MLAVLGVLAIVAVAVNLGLNAPTGQQPPAPSADIKPEDLNKEIAQLLPQLERENDVPETEENTSLWDGIDPFAMPMALVGVVVGGNKDLAIIEARHTTYIASQGETVAGIWEVVEINRDTVRLKSDNQEIVIGLEQRD